MLHCCSRAEWRIRTQRQRPILPWLLTWLRSRSSLLSFSILSRASRPIIIVFRSHACTCSGSVAGSSWCLLLILVFFVVIYYEWDGFIPFTVPAPAPAPAPSPAPAPAPLIGTPSSPAASRPSASSPPSPKVPWWQVMPVPADYAAFECLSLLAFKTSIATLNAFITPLFRCAFLGWARRFALCVSVVVVILIVPSSGSIMISLFAVFYFLVFFTIPCARFGIVDSPLVFVVVGRFEFF